MVKRMLLLAPALLLACLLGNPAAQAQVNGGNTGIPPSAAPALVATTGSIAPGILIAGACGSGTVAVTGSTTSMTVAVSANTYPGDGVYPSGYVSSNGTVTVKVCAIVGLTPRHQPTTSALFPEELKP